MERRITIHKTLAEAQAEADAAQVDPSCIRVELQQYEKLTVIDTRSAPPRIRDYVPIPPGAMFVVTADFN